jgi:hypothetical protein
VYVLSSGLSSQEIVSPIADTGAFQMPPPLSLRRDLYSQAKGLNIIYEVSVLPPLPLQRGGLVPSKKGRLVRIERVMCHPAVSMFMCD